MPLRALLTPEGEGAFVPEIDLCLQTNGAGSYATWETSAFDLDNQPRRDLAVHSYGPHAQVWYPRPRKRG